MKEICLVYMDTGDYDSYSSDVILAFETLEEGQQAIMMMKAELAAVWSIPEPADTFRNLDRAERVAGAYDRLRNEYAAQVRDLIKVFPATFQEFQGVTFVGSIPDETEQTRGNLEFRAVMQPISKLVDLLSSSAKQNG